MKRFLPLVLILVTFTASAVELERATNEQILAELSLRLASGGGEKPPVQEPQRWAEYKCVDPNYLQVEVFDSSKLHQAPLKNVVNVGSKTTCEDQVASLNRLRSRVEEEFKVFVCGADGYLFKYVLEANGSLLNYGGEKLEYSACLRRAREVNRQRKE